MYLSQLIPLERYPRVQYFLRRVLEMQFNDVRAMLQLPRPDVGIIPGCNFAIASVTCNMLSGISTTLYMPHGATETCGSGEAFRGLVLEFFPYAPSAIGAATFADDLYKLCRNPLSHSASLLAAGSPLVVFTRVFSASHDGIGWTSEELDSLELAGENHGLHPGISVDGNQWQLHCDSFYLDAINLLRRLTSNAEQMDAAEKRFKEGRYNWRR